MFFILEHQKTVELTHLVVKWSAVRNQSEIETSLKMRGMSPFLFVKLVQQRRTQNYAKPAHWVCRSSGQPFTGTTRSAGVGGVGLALAVLAGLAKNSDIGRVGKKMVLRRIPIYFLSTIFHDRKPKLASQKNVFELYKYTSTIFLIASRSLSLTKQPDTLTGGGSSSANNVLMM